MDVAYPMIMGRMGNPHHDFGDWMVGVPAVNLMRGIPFPPSPADAERNYKGKFSHHFLANDTTGLPPASPQYIVEEVPAVPQMMWT